MTVAEAVKGKLKTGEDEWVEDLGLGYLGVIFQGLCPPGLVDSDFVHLGEHGTLLLSLDLCCFLPLDLRSTSAICLAKITGIAATDNNSQTSIHKVCGMCF